MKNLIFKEKKLLLDLLIKSFQWHLNYFIKKTPRPLSCGIYLTSRCNFRCEFCNIWRKKDPVTLPLDRLKKIIDDLETAGCFYLSFSGGEPLIVDYFDDLLGYLAQSKIAYKHLVTNGYLLDKNVATRLASSGLNEISISIDGEESFHDRRRGISGAWSKALKAIENIKEFAPKIKVVINTIFLPWDLRQIDTVLELSEKLDVYMKVQPINKHPVFNKDNFSELPQETADCLGIKKITKKLKKSERIINSNAFLDAIYDFFCDKDNLILKNDKCLFGFHHLELLETGEIFPCLEGMNWENGFDYRGQLKEILSSNRYLNQLDELKTCQNCQKSCYVCYYEPRIVFPLKNAIKHFLIK